MGSVTAAPAGPGKQPTPTRRGREPHGRTGRDPARRVATLALTGVAVYVVLPSLSAVVGAFPKLATLSIVWLALALVAEATSFGCGFAIQRLVLRTTGWFAVVTSGLSGNAVTNALPGGDAAGAAVQFRMLSAAGVKTDTAAGGLAASSLVGIGGLLLLPILTLPAIIGRPGVSHALVEAALLGLAGFVLYMGLGVALLGTDRPILRIGRAAQWIWNKLHHSRPALSGLDRRLLQQRNEIRHELGKNWRRIVLLVAGRLGFDFFCLVACLRATGSEPRPWLVLLAYSAAGVVALVPLTPGGLGIVEASLSGLLVLSGVGAADAVVATLAYRLLQYWLPMVAGAVAYRLFRRRYPADEVLSQRS